MTPVRSSMLCVRPSFSACRWNGKTFAGVSSAGSCVWPRTVHAWIRGVKTTSMPWRSRRSPGSSSSARPTGPCASGDMFFLTRSGIGVKFRPSPQRRSSTSTSSPSPSNTPRPSPPLSSTRAARHRGLNGAAVMSCIERRCTGRPSITHSATHFSPMSNVFPSCL